MRRIGVFSVGVGVWFLFWLAVWYVAHSLFMAPVYLLVKAMVALLFPAWAGTVHWMGHDFVLSTTLPLGSADGRAVMLAVKANFLTYGIGWPLVVALYLACDADRIVLKIALSTVVLWAPQTIGILVELLHAVYVQSGLLAIDGATRYLLIVLFQFLIMVMPPLAPVVVWLRTEEEFVRSLVAPLAAGPAR